jgi:hypothetical protein
MGRDGPILRPVHLMAAASEGDHGYPAKGDSEY